MGREIVGWASLGWVVNWGFVKTGRGQAKLDLGGQSREWNRGGAWRGRFPPCNGVKMGKLSLLLGWGGKD